MEMDMSKFIEKLEDVISSYRKQLAENDPSTLSNIGNSFKVSMQGLKAGVTGNDEAKRILEQFKDHMNSFEEALKNNNHSAASQALDNMSRALQTIKLSSAVI